MSALEQASREDAPLSGRAKVHALVDAADEALQRGNMAEYLRRYEALGMTPPPSRLEQYGEDAFRAGRLDDGLFVFTYLGETPDPFYLELCAETAEDPAIRERARLLLPVIEKRAADELREEAEAHRSIVDRFRAAFAGTLGKRGGGSAR